MSASWDHPRTRGEHTASSVLPASVPGPPPHTRGTPQTCAETRRGWRTTPAHAGNTTRRCAARSSTADHPRTRGEHAASAWWVKRCRGPPPHTRGTLPDDDPFGAMLWDHPRTRGEHTREDAQQIKERGPPPHTRGTPSSRDSAASPAGTTPAHAGNTACHWPTQRSASDHPRTRGEHSDSSSIEPRILGPPPHTRGTRAGPLGRGVRRGTTPAHAGNTSRVLSPRGDFRDHPRTRGEHHRPPIVTCFSCGPPPHTRGTRRHPQPHLVLRGDHPRTRGEHLRALPPGRSVEGPPPHTRGTPLARRRQGARRGTTPAHAGNTPPARCRGRPTPGPPPHTRGTRRWCTRPPRTWRTTPAHAGNTCRGTANTALGRDHPRTRGEHA